MKISIHNFKNIVSGELALDDNRCNVLLGVSGVGKSSIAESLNPDNYENNQSFLCAGKTESFIDGHVPSNSDVVMFSPDKRISIREAATADDGYELLIDERLELEDAEQKLESLLKSLLPQKGAWDKDIEFLRDLNKSLKNKAIGKEKKQLQKSSLLRQFLEACESNGKPVSVVREIEGVGADKARWVDEGFSYIERKSDDNWSCPYCEKRMGDSLRRRAVRFHEFQLESVESLESNPGVKAELGDPVSLAVNRTTIVEKAIGMIKVVEEYDDFCSLVERLNSGDLNVKIGDLKKERPHLYKRIPEIESALSSIAAGYSSMKTALAKVRSAAANAVKMKRRFINDALERFGIPYCVEYSTHNQKIVGASITHKRNMNPVGEADDSNRLSEGEKTIVSLILFVLRASMNKTAKLIVFDDPISNFNNERRQELLRLIQSKLNKRTIVLLTYDQSFVKVALADHGLAASAQFIGNKNGFIFTKPITMDSFVRMEDAILDACERCSNSSYLRKIANLRYYYEIKQHDGKPRPAGEIPPRTVYGYLSFLVHGLKSKRSEFEDKLNEIPISLQHTEDEILQQIKIDTKVELPPAEYSHLFQGNFDDFEYWLEKAIILRETLPSKNTLRGSLSSLVHLNSALVICLNPFEFDMCSSFVSDGLDKLTGPVSSLFPGSDE